MHFSTPIPLSLYVHLPWCIRKCPYCDFNSHAVRGDLPEEHYIHALLRDLDEQLPKVWGRRPISIFFGGGTPSLFSPQSIEKILSALHARFKFNADIEITLEANPGTIDAERFRGFRQAGINRLSIGLQSLQNDKLKILGRIHDRDHALRAIEHAVNAGFDNFNLDIMHGLPGQSLQDALGDLEDALQFKPPHLSWYQLTIEPNTFFHYRPPPLPDETILENIQSHGHRLLEQFHLSQYEVSAYAKPGHACVHNTNYWEFGDYLGIGAGAHSKITDFETQTVTRCSQVKHPRDYLEAPKKNTSEIKILSKSDLIFEFMLNALRLTSGVPVQLFEERTGLSASVLAPYLKKAVDQKLLMDASFYLCATKLGQRFLNDAIGVFLCSE